MQKAVKERAATKARKMQVPSEVRRVNVAKVKKMIVGGPERASCAARKYY